MCGVALFAAQGASIVERPVWAVGALTVLMLGAALVARLVLVRVSSKVATGVGATAIALGLIVAGVLPYVSAGWVLESSMLACVQWAVLWLLAGTRHNGAAVCAGLLLLLGISSPEARHIAVPTVLFAATAAAWMSTSSTAPRVSTVAVLCVAATAALVLWLLPAERLAMSRGNYLPSSGGDSAGSDAAQSGVGDGPDVVAAVNSPKSIGFDESDIFLNAKQPGLYDAFVESFGEPLGASPAQRMIGLKQDQIRSLEMHAEDDLRNGRRFDIRRQAAAPRAPDGAAHGATALLWVSGRQPLHMPLVSYDRFDGFALQAAPAHRTPASLRNTQRPTWMQIVGVPECAGYDGRTEFHEIKIGMLDTDVLPLAAYTRAFELGRVNRPGMFQVNEAHRFVLATRKLPPGAVLRSERFVLDPASMNQVNFARPRASQRNAWTVSTSITSLAQQWGKDAPRGWTQISQVIQKVRTHAPLDSNTPNTDDIETFLMHDRAGPAYMFATSAAVLLRALDYDVRVVGGFYADPDRHDSRSNSTPLSTADAHVWVEIRSLDNTWITLEPTPGYYVAAPPQTWTAFTVGLIQQYWHVSVIASLCIACVWLTRRAIIDRLATVRVTLVRDPRRSIDATAKLVSLRARLAGREKPASATLRKWLSPLLDATPLASDAARFVELSEAATYAPVVNLVGAVDTCRAARATLTRRFFYKN